MRTKRIFFIALIFAASARAFAGEVVIQDGALLAAFDSASGSLTRLENKSTHWIIERRRELAVSFRLFAPLPQRHYNPVLGQNQRAAEVKKISDHEVRLQWKNLLSENGGALPMTLNADVTLTDGALTFAASLANDSPLTVETIDYPYLGDLNPPAREATLQLVVRRDNKSAALASDEIYPHFHSEKGYYGVFYPLKVREARQSPFCLIQSPRQGLYVAMVNSPLPYQVQYTFEEHPGLLSSIDELVPQQDEISGTPVHLEFRVCHFVFAAPHSATTLTRVVLRCYSGDEQAGRDLHQ